MLWWIVIAVLVAAPIVVRLTTGKWGTGKPGQTLAEVFVETYKRHRNTPRAREDQKERNYYVVVLLCFGLPLGLLLVCFCDWMNYSRAIYVPVVSGVMLSASMLLAVYLYGRRIPPRSDKA
jgi:hypothetical protein